MTYTKITVEKKNRIALLTLNDPETRNAITDKVMMQEILSACADIEADAEISVLVLTGAGKGFSSGGNVKSMRYREGMFAGSIETIEENYRSGIHKVVKTLYEMNLPVIAAINGAAIGAGLDFTLLCDLRIASSCAVFGSTFINLGIIPGDGGSWLLRNAIGEQKAAELVFTGRIFDAEEALQLGMLLEVTEPEQLMSRAMQIATELAQKSPLALRETKRLLRAARHAELPAFLEMCAKTQSRLHHSDEHHEAIRQFFIKQEKK